MVSLLFLHKVGGVRKNKPYLPSWRSGPYAILLALLEGSQKPDYPGNEHVCTYLLTPWSRVLLEKLTV